MKYRSKLRASQERNYHAQKSVWLKDKNCEGCLKRFNKITPATEVHHSVGRAGKNLTDERYWVALCFECHRWTHDHPAMARELGLLCELGRWNNVETPD